MNKSPEISCIVPVYKTEKYLQKCVDSILSQTFTDFELILVDDGSPDNSGKICDEYAEKDSRVKVIHQQNGGLACARNTGLKNSSGDFLYFCDSDDWLEPDLLESLCNKAMETGADIVGCDLFKETSKGQIVIKNELAENSEESLRLLLIEKVQGWLHIKFFKRSLFDNEDCKWISGINVCEDFLICSKLFFHAKRITYFPKALYHYNCLNETSLTASLSEEKINQIFRAYNEVKKFLENKGIVEKYAEELDYAEICNINWILISCKKQKFEYYKYLERKKYYKNKYAALSLKIYLFFGFYKIHLVTFLIIQLKRNLLPKR